MPRTDFLSKEFARAFLLGFTKELIMNSAPIEILKIRGKKEEKEIKNKVNDFKKLQTETQNDLKKILPISQENIPKKKITLNLQRPRFPPQFWYLKPIPTKTQIDIGKLNPLLKDPLVREIECQGINQPIFVKGTMGEKKTSIFLDQEEIEEVINKFSNATRIPIKTGTTNIVFGNLILSAIISENPIFSIKKILFVRDKMVGRF
ncbi:hypothetical protein COU58_04550 [Candidatus Pacearchaeota archaeon CG10_big_fil_rev_8_21_14_0_10_32_42]|nr:MAG: hypothetical protein COU58_04550 [Candidatus Pacearchaeota archaeon CG10_big_fil_rev_8_21_14_0_10_32_42]